MIANISTPRPGVTEPRDVTRVFKLISAPWTRARFSDVVGLALRFDALTIRRPGMVNEMEWSEVDWDAKGQGPLGTVVFAPSVPHDLRSVSRSVVDLASGIALAASQLPPPEAKLSSFRTRRTTSIAYSEVARHETT
jgi:hypothetical protein